mgnify:CR=1 FL=1|tara:strand:+ start:1242 stop:1745 length:504 start_codon:yes stop_codon:yes gene_type:complete
MKIKDRLEFNNKLKPVCLKPENFVRDAINIMSEKNIGSIMIANEDNTIAGIITERDLLKKVLFKKMNPDKTRLSEVMTTDLKVAKENDDLLDWLRIMSNERFRHVPVVDKDQKIIGIMSQGDFVSYTWPELLSRMKENVKATFDSGYQIVFIVFAMLAYALIVSWIL